MQIQSTQRLAPSSDADLALYPFLNELVTIKADVSALCQVVGLTKRSLLELPEIQWLLQQTDLTARMQMRHLSPRPFQAIDLETEHWQILLDYLKTKGTTRERLTTVCIKYELLSHENNDRGNANDAGAVDGEDWEDSDF